MTWAHAFCALCATSSLLVSTSTARPAAPTSRVGEGDGILAVQAEGQTAWRIAELADGLPDVSDLRTGGLGSRVVELDGATLHIDPETELLLNSSGHRIVVRRGRLILVNAASPGWTISSGDLSTSVSEKSVSQVAYDPGGDSRVRVLRGRATATSRGRKQHALVGPTSLVLNDDHPDGTQATLSDEMQRVIEKSISRTHRSQGLGQLLIKDAQSNSMRRLDVARYHVNIVIEPTVALVQIDQTFYNPYGRQEQGTFVFNLPGGASVSRFAMYVTPEQLIEGELLERGRAANIYDTIVSRRRDPAILEQIGDSLFRMRVFPIFARDTKRVLLDYTVPVQSNDGVCRFQLPLLSDLEPIWDFRISGTVRGSTGAKTFLCDTYPELEITPGDNGVKFQLTRQDFRPERDFVLSFRRDDEPGVSVRSYLAKPLKLPTKKKSDDETWTDPLANKDVTYFHATIPASAGEELPNSTAPADVLILADSSSSIRSRNLLRRTVRTIIRNLRDTDRFQLGCVDVDFRPLHDEWTRPRTAAADRVLDRFAEEFFLGTTDMRRNLGTGLEQFDRTAKDRRRLVVYVGDGSETAWRIPMDDIANEIKRRLKNAGASFSAVTIDADGRGDFLMDELISASGGQRFDGNKRSGHRDLLRWLLGGMPCAHRVVSVSVPGVASHDVFFPELWLPGEPLHIYVRTAQPEKLHFTLNLAVGGESRRLRLPVEISKRKDDVFIGRLWAQRKLRQLTGTEKRLSEGDPALRRQIIGLSQEWSLLSPHTAFLVLETEQDYATWGIERRARRRYWKPAGRLEDELLPPKWLARVQAARAAAHAESAFEIAMRTAREALQQKRYARALSALDDVRGLPSAVQSRSFAALREQASVGVRRDAAFRDACREFALFDPAGLPNRLRELGSPRFSHAIAASWSQQANPFSDQLLREVEIPSVSDRGGDFSIVDWIEHLTALDVMVDRRSLDDYGIDLDALQLHQFRMCGTGRMSLWNYCRSSLRNIDLVLVQQEDGLLITTVEGLEETTDTRVYPVADLLHTNRVPSYSDLFLDPLQQHEEEAERRVKERLERPVSFHYDRALLSAALEDISVQFGDNILIDHVALHDVGLVSKDVKVSGRARGLPARAALRRLLKELDLDFYVDREAVVVTTPEEVEANQKIRLYSGLGLVMEWRTDMPWSPWAAPNPFALGGGLAGMGGMGGGGGFFGGTAGFGGGVGGGFGGGMGGFGGGDALGGGGAMGGGGGMFGGPPAVAASGSDNLFSQGGTDEETNLSDEDLVAAEDAGGDATPDHAPVGDASEGTSNAGGTEPTVQGAVTAVGADDAATDVSIADAPSPSRYVIDSDSTIEMITSTIAPVEWVDAGGAASIEFYEPTLDFVVTASDRIHDQIEELFQRLREMPPAVDPKAEGRPVREPPKYPPNVHPDFDSLEEIINISVSPVSWVNVGGRCEIEFDVGRLAMVVLAYPEVHDQVSRLLTALRRSRYELHRGERPWESTGARGLLSGYGVTRFDEPDTGRTRRGPFPEEVALLAARRQLTDIHCRWRWSMADDSPSVELAVHRHDEGVEFKLPGQRLRIQDDLAAVAYPGLTLVEFGPWGESACRWMDTCLPWFPHRTNEELARMFDVQPMSGESTDEVVALRLTPPVAGDATGTYLKLCYARRDGAPTTVEAYVKGDLASRLQFADRGDGPGEPPWKKVTLEDARGKPVMRWELIESRKDGAAIPPLSQGWDGYVRLDRRSPQPSNAHGFRAVLDAIRDHDWSAAYGALQNEMDRDSDQPLLRFLRAWCHAKDHRLGSEHEMIEDLQAVARSRASELTRALAKLNFTDLRPREMYDLMSLQPPETRSAGDCERLARLAVSASRLDVALQHARASLDKPDINGRRFERVFLIAELLLRLGRKDEAAREAHGWQIQPDKCRVESIRLANLLSAYGRRGDAAALLAAAARHKAVSPGDRYAILLRQAELESSPIAAADLCWHVEEAGFMPSAKLRWACQQMNQAEQSERVVALLERRLRNGVDVSTQVLSELEAAYLALQRTLDARRAYEQDPPPPPPPPPTSPSRNRLNRGLPGGFF